MTQNLGVATQKEKENENNYNFLKLCSCVIMPLKEPKGLPFFQKYIFLHFLNSSIKKVEILLHNKHGLFKRRIFSKSNIPISLKFYYDLKNVKSCK